MNGKKPDWGTCPNCREELLNISGSEENLLLCGKCGKTFPEPAPITKKTKAKRKQKLRLPFGKHKGKSLEIVFAEEPSYLCWFYDAVDGFENVKQAIAALPEFATILAKYRERRQFKDKSLEQRIEEVVCRMFAVDPRPADVDSLCDRLFNGPETKAT